jgi:hypothetical protein
VELIFLCYEKIVGCEVRRGRRDYEFRKNYVDILTHRINAIIRIVIIDTIWQTIIIYQT